jgi:hypothetical protein
MFKPPVERASVLTNDTNGPSEHADVDNESANRLSSYAVQVARCTRVRRGVTTRRSSWAETHGFQAKVWIKKEVAMRACVTTTTEMNSAMYQINALVVVMRGSRP